MMLQYLNLIRPKAFSSRIVLLIVVIVLGGLMFLKYTGRQDIFSYQGIKSQTPGFSDYKLGITSINKFLNTKTGESSQSITQGIAFLQSAFQKTKDKQLLDILSGEISKAKGIEFFEQTKLCYTLLASGYMTIGNITDTYANIMSGYAQMQTTFKENISVLPNSKTKTCMQSYLDGLQGSLESLTLTYKNIDGLNSQYQNLLVAYKGNGGECGAIGGIVNNLTDLYVKMQSVNAIIGQVQKNLDSKEVSKYDELCKFGGIQGLSGLQQSSRQVLSSTKEIVPKLKRVTNIGQYIKDLQNKAKEISN